MPRPEPVKSPKRADRPAPGAPAGAAAASDAPKKKKNEVLEWLKSLGTAVVLFLVIRTFLMQAFSIPSSSMEPTLQIGDYLMANNAIFGAHVPFTDARLPAFRDPRHGDIVVFRPTYNNPVIDVVKRVIGEPGDTLRMVDGTVYRNGQALVEPYVQRLGTPDHAIENFGSADQGMQGVDPQQYGAHWHLDALPAGVDRATYAPTRDNWGPLVVPAGHYFLMGDNREASLDSRFMGFIPRDVIRGKPMFIYFSYDPAAGAPFTRALTDARWSRIGDLIH